MAVDERSLTEDLQPAQREPGTAREGEEALPFPCPECERRFKNKQGLARHRSVAHGIKGQSRGGKKRKKTTTSRPRSRAVAAAAGFPPELNRTRLLGVIAPSATIPITMLGRVSNWLDEAEVIHASLVMEQPKKKRRRRRKNGGSSANGAGS